MPGGYLWPLGEVEGTWLENYRKLTGPLQDNFIIFS